MYLSRDELEKIHMQEDILKGNITNMCLAHNYEELGLNQMTAKDRIDNMYEILRDHLAAEYDKEMKRIIEKEKAKNWWDIPSDEMSLEQAQQVVKDSRKSREVTYLE